MWLQKILYNITKLDGWTYKIEIPPHIHHAVVIGAPHTSNWDFIPAMGIIHYMNKNARIMVKASLLKFPLNIFLRQIGAIGVDREKLQEVGGAKTTDQVTELFKNSKELFLMISPEGTRKPNDKWKTGFYYIAKKANIPIVVVYADYELKEVGVADIIYPDDFETDMKRINDLYSKYAGKNPENFKLDKRFS